MKKTFKYFSLITLTTFVFVLTGCGLFGPSLPKPTGKKVNMTVSQLENRISKLSFSDINYTYGTVESILEAKVNHVEDSYSGKSQQKVTVNLKNNDTWVDYKLKLKEGYGEIDSQVKGFQSSRRTYFGVKVKNNYLFDEDYMNDIDIFAGKYQLENDGYNERDEIADILKQLAYSFGDDDIIIDKLKFETVFVFERNRLVAAGTKTSFKLHDEEGTGDMNNITVVKFHDKAQKNINYNNYRKIEGLEDIFRN